jgi:hypothetical protein
MSMMMGLHSIGEKEFFVRAPEIYRLQGETGRLCLTPFFRLIRNMIAEWGVGGSLRNFYRLGSYIRRHSWQMFFFIDVCSRPRLGRGRYPFLTFHDRIFAPATNFKLCDAVTGLLCFVWFIGILPPFFWLIEHFPARSHPPQAT